MLVMAISEKIIINAEGNNLKGHNVTLITADFIPVSPSSMIYYLAGDGEGEAAPLRNERYDVHPRLTRCRQGMRSHMGSENKIMSAGPQSWIMAVQSFVKLFAYFLQPLIALMSSGVKLDENIVWIVQHICCSVIIHYPNESLPVMMIASDVHQSLPIYMCLTNQWDCWRYPGQTLSQYRKQEST